ncbi:hypothetical protein BO70DRAFT_397252 [Aspergillus heteromorphus CBS 117.55]|uniref:MARVEL domain-containing protein n=1 Tax=Aspergillus heteromorphus CBS 117.55 TaxID=1448321 RepID=A0A317VZC0_9EURO|nr:uncharacterized protein BO70DRAFT_397252 [Aspergillus heteromorphus CBS 117.55]PWY79135.1 hypothetical protein BO70DRAFT_397252 [Aspergillus heteromorphus CBS 117.55]
MQLPRPSFNPGRTKNLIHGLQAFIIFLAWALTIAVFTRGDGIDGRSAWYWALCWFSVPGLIYLVAVPMWPRARRFGNVYAFATIDCLYAILWFTAWVCVASYVAEGKSKGKSSSTTSSSSTSTSTSKSSRSTSTSTSKSGCDNWAYGDASKCKISTATVIMGVVIFLLFIVTAFMSFRNVAHFRRTGTLPDAVSDPTFAAQSKAAFSSNPAHDFEEEEDDFRSRAGIGTSVRGDRDEDYALLQQSEVDEFGNSHAARSALSGAYDPTVSAGASVLHDYSTSYGGAHGQHYGTPSEFGTNVSGYGR